MQYPRAIFAARDGRLFATLQSLNDGSLQYSDTLDGTWVSSTFPNTKGLRTVVSESADGTLATITIDSSEVCRSKDGGQTFGCLPAPVGGGVTLWAAELPEGLFVSSSGTYLSTDDGATFRNLARATGGIAALDGTIYASGLRYRPGQDRWFDTVVGVQWIGAGGAVFGGKAGGGVQVSRDLGATWTSVWDQAPTILATNAAGTVAALVANQGAFVYRAGGWAQIGPTKDQTYSELAVLADGRVAVVDAGKNNLFVTSAPVSADPIIGTDYPASCNDGTLNGDEEAVDCGGSCTVCAEWNVLALIPYHSVLLATPKGTLLALPKTGNSYQRSVDDGHTWTEAKLPGDAYAVVLGPDGTVYVESSSGDLYASTDDGKSFSKVNTQRVPVVGRLVVTPSNALLVNASDSSAARSLDGGATWQAFDLPTTYGGLFALASGSLFEGGQNSLQRSRDDGVTWQSLASPAGSVTGGGYYAAGPGVIAFERDQLYISEDEGDTWQLVTRPNGVQLTGSLRATASGRLVFLTDRVYVSDSKGADWRTVEGRGYPGASSSVAYPAGTLSDGRFFTDAPGNSVGLSTDPDRW